MQDGGCWLWIGGRKKAGYGQFAVDGKKVIAHRWAYSHFIGPIPAGYEIDHTCRNSSCVNPDHLEAITLEENRRRRVAAKTHCSKGHRYTEATTYWWTDRDGYRCRFCLPCRAETSRNRNK